MDELGPEAFDFWIGEWDCAFEGGHAVNTVTLELDGQMIQERFVADAHPSARQSGSTATMPTAGDSSRSWDGYIHQVDDFGPRRA